MTTTFELEHGRAAISAWRLALEERSYEALQLPRDIQALFLGAGGANLRRLLDGLVYAGALTLDLFAAFVREMCTGPHCMQAQQLNDLVVHLRQAPAPLTAVAIAAMLRAQVAHFDAAFTKAEAATTVLALSVTLTPAQLHNILTVSNGNRDNRVIPPSYLRSAVAVAHEYNGVSFATRLATSIALADGLVKSRKLVALMAALGVPAMYAGELLHALEVIAPDKFTRMNNFLAAASLLVTVATPWSTRIMAPLRHFRTAQRSPFGPNTPFPNVAFAIAGSGLLKTMTHARLLWVPDTHINYFCNSHTFAHCNIAERISRNVAIDFWQPTYRKPQVENLFTLMTPASLQGHVDHAPPYFHQDVGQTEVGVNLIGPGHAQFYAVTHMAPAVAHYRVENNVLVALQHLF
jgi:hypothetical protein